MLKFTSNCGLTFRVLGMRFQAYSLVIVVAFAALLPQGAGAATREEQTKNCRGDAIHFCAIDIPSEQKITACMKAHYEELSPGCKAMFEAPPHPDPDTQSNVPNL